MKTIRFFPEDMDLRTQYKLIKSPDSQKMSSAEDSVLKVKSWILFTDEDFTGDEREVLVIETEDGEIFATVSDVFKREFLGITNFFGDDVGDLRIVGGKSRNGRNFITCSVF